MSTAERTPSKHGWMIEALNDMRSYAQENGLIICEDALNESLTTIVIALGMDEPAELLASDTSKTEFVNVVNLGRFSKT